MVGNTENTAKATSFRTYWCCMKHTDVFHSLTAIPDSPDLYDNMCRACSYLTLCDLHYIGYREYDSTNQIIKDTTPDAEWFKRKGHFTREDLEFTKPITLQPAMSLQTKMSFF